jgi:hypothetical protein
MDYVKLIKKIVAFLRKNLTTLLFINLFIGYLTLLIVFIMVITDCHTPAPSDWFYENFSISENQEIHSFYSKLLKNQEPLGKEFEKVIYENLWDLYEN